MNQRLPRSSASHIQLLLILSFMLVGCAVQASPANQIDPPHSSTSRPAAEPPTLFAPQSTPGASVRPTEQTTPRPTQPPVTVQPLSPTAQAFNVRAKNFRLVDDEIMVDVCFDMPDTRDWMVWRAHFHTGGAMLDLNSSESLDYRQATEDGQPGQRCDSLGFYLPPGTDTSDAELLIDSISAYPREGQYCTYLLETVQPLLEEREAGIQLACTEGAGFSDARVVGKPETMTQEQAEKIAFSDEFFTITGPWTFSAGKIAAATPYPTVAMDDPQASAFALLQTLSQRLDASLPQPGWLLVEEDWQHDVDTPNFGTYGVDTPLPTAYRRETWYYFDVNGRVTKSATFLQSNPDRRVGISTFTNGVLYDHSTGATYDQPPYFLHLNPGYIGNLWENARQGRGKTGRIEFEGQPALEFVLDEEINYDNPQFYNQKIATDQVTVIIDETSGQIRQLKTVVHLADGSERTLEFMRLRMLRGRQPPPDVLAALENANHP